MRQIPISEHSAAHFWTIEYILKKHKINYFWRSTIKRGLFLSVFNKPLTYIYNIHTLHRRIIVQENMVQPVLFNRQTILQEWGGGDHK